MSAQHDHLLTVEEYFALEERVEVRHLTITSCKTASLLYNTYNYTCKG
jgi:hypothetical protein